MDKLKISSIALFALFALLVGTVSAAPILLGEFDVDGWYVEDDEGREASAEFELDGSELKITLKNESNDIADGAWNPNEGLAGIFFDAAFDLTIKDVKAFDVMAYDEELGYLGSNVDVSGEFAYSTIADILSDGTYSQYFVSASSLDGDWGGAVDPMGVDALIDPTNMLTNPPQPADGPDFLILNTDDPGQPFSEIPWINNQVVITWYLPTEFQSFISNSGDLVINDIISNVYFAYGTDYAAPVPEPATILLLGTGLIGIAGIGRRKFKK